MIDIENVIFTRLANAIRTEFSGISVYGEYIETPASFPCVTVVEADNRVLERTRDLSGVEHNARVMYEINVYTNDANGKKAKAKEISNVIDNVMSELLFTRTFRGQTPNIDRTIYRITLRYIGVVSENHGTDENALYVMHTMR